MAAPCRKANPAIFSISSAWPLSRQSTRAARLCSPSPVTMKSISGKWFKKCSRSRLAPMPPNTVRTSGSTVLARRAISMPPQRLACRMDNPTTSGFSIARTVSMASGCPRRSCQFNTWTSWPCSTSTAATL